MHVHVSLVEFLITSAFIILFSFFWRLGTAKLIQRNEDSALAKGMAFIL